LILIDIETIFGRLRERFKRRLKGFNKRSQGDERDHKGLERSCHEFKVDLSVEIWDKIKEGEGLRREFWE
jgi:hypothetical protein